MFGTTSLATQSQFKGVSVVSVSPRNSEKYVDIKWSNGKTTQGEAPYSMLPLYQFDVEYQDMRHDSAILLEAVPKRLPLNLMRLATLMGSCRVEYDLEKLLYSSVDEFDSRAEAEDQTGNIKKNWPDLYEMLESKTEGVLYLHFEDVSLLPKIYKMEIVHMLGPKDLLKTAHMARNTPTLLAFKSTLPNPILHEITEQEFEKLVMVTGYSFSIAEKAAILVYNNWLKQDIAYGNCYSLLVHSKKHIFADEGLEFLKKNNLITIEKDKYVILTQVLQWDESIRESCEILKERFQKNIPIPERDHQATPYQKKEILKPLSEEQDAALNDVILKNPVAILSGAAGTGKTTILGHLVNRFAPGTILGCAPTNRAARVLTKKVILSKTIHKIFAEMVSQDTTLKLDEIRMIFMDEASMTPLRLFSYFLEMLVKRCPNLERFYLIGDVSQLESVEAGTVLKDMSDFFPSVFLQKNHRVTPQAQLIHENAVKIKNQSTNIIIDPSCFNFSPFTRILYNDLEETIKNNPEMTAWNSHFISPFREESKNIGSLVKQFLTGKIYSGGVFHKGDKILCTKNYNALGVINGDFFKICEILVVAEEIVKKDIPGPLTKTEKIKNSVESTASRIDRSDFFRFMVVHAGFTEEDKIEMETAVPYAIDIGNHANKIPLSSFTLGYCTTNHQFQGCEADYIVFDLRKVSYFVNWKQLYTAVTRGKKKVIILGNMDNLVACISSKVFPRRSMLFQHLETPNAFLKSLPPVEQDIENRLMYLLSEVSVEDNNTETTNKRTADEDNNAFSNNAKKRRY